MDGRALAELEGRVVVGNRVGRTLGVPTANIAYDPARKCLPDGVYVADVVLLEQGNKVYQGVLNQGSHPTVPKGEPAVEIHLFDFQGLLYGQCVRIRYWHFLRDEITYPSRQSMRVQMQRDIRDAREWFTHHPDYLAG
ncbi:MAG: riboflavin kinase [Eubacteriales bacterium]|nr:riboflavin kinase [Eubacteriales bacterium]